MIKIEKIDSFAKNREYPPTPPQWQAISITGADILVAAAAGSGKTEVLSERIARKVACDRWDIDKMLVLTFTTAAAKNMLVRIENKITERLLATELEEDRLFLRKQRMLMNNALVTTIDSFCLSVLKKFYYLVEEKIDGEYKYLSPNFSVLPNSKNLLVDAINEVLEQYAKEDKNITDSLFTILGDKNNIVLSIIDVYYKLLTIPNFEEYLDKDFLGNLDSTLQQFNLVDYELIEQYEKLESLTTKEEITLAVNYAKNVRSFIDGYKEYNIDKLISNSILSDTKKEKISKEIFKDEKQSLLGSKLKKIEEIDELIRILERELEADGDVFNAEDLNNAFITLNNYLSIFQIAKHTYDFSNNFRTVLISVHEQFIKKKRANNFLDFSDLNHLAIKALVHKNEGKLEHTEAANYYRDYFLEIYVDEYQDNNNLQEYILNIIKGDNVNFFRVGDVKQAIYGFRGSNPDLFEEKYNSYKKLFIENYDINKDYSLEYEGVGICILLKENFRSHENILKSSNYVFNRLMADKNAGISYDEESALYYPTVKKKNNNVIPTRLINGKVSYFTGVEQDDKKLYRVQSIENIASEILKGIEEGNKYSDYAVLVRNSTKMIEYKNIFSKYNIPLFFKEKVGFTISICFNLLFNLFNFLDNTNREASLIALLHSEIFDYSNDELLELSLKDGKNLFEKIKNSATEKDKKTLNIFNKWLNFSLNNSLIDLLEKISKDIDFINYLVTISVSDEEVDYYENFRDLVIDYQNLDNKLSGFVNHLKNIKDEEVFETKKKVPNNSVTLSTIHISKGLEYKYVFVSDLDTSFSKRGYSGEVLFTEEFGLSIDIDNLCKKYNISTIENSYFNNLYKLNSNLIRIKEREEEVRNLYVALTRAEKVLYLVSPEGIELNKEEAMGNNVSKALFEEGDFEKILNVVLNDYSEDNYQYTSEHGASFEQYIPEVSGEIVESGDENNYEDYLKEFYSEFSNKALKGEQIIEGAKSKNKFFPAKTSYSALKKINKQDEFIKNKEDKKGYLELSNLSKATSTSKAILRGNVVHKLFERIINDVRKNKEINDIDNYLESLVKKDSILINIKEQRILTEEEYNLINNLDDKLKIYNFINNELIETVRTAKNCETEVAFTISKQAQQLYKESISEKEVILQGVVDLLVILNEKEYMIIDYKTDNVSVGAGESILIERHKEQLRIYKEAVEQYYCVENVQTYIYSYTLSKLIKVEC